MECMQWKKGLLEDSRHYGFMTFMVVNVRVTTVQQPFLAILVI